MMDGWMDGCWHAARIMFGVKEGEVGRNCKGCLSAVSMLRPRQNLAIFMLASVTLGYVEDLFLIASSNICNSLVSKTNFFFFYILTLPPSPSPVCSSSFTF
jgi:hypothetical protein